MIFFKGMAMGAADVVPGVSGGTIAFITGIYDELIDSIKAFDLQAAQLLLQADWRRLWQHVNGSFLLTLLAGIVTSVLSLARVITYALEHQPVLIAAFFFGLILASALFILRQVERWNPGRALLLLAGISLATAISVLRPNELPLEWYWVFLSGVLAICAMILPGISGSFILLMLGMYGPVLGAIKSLQLPVLLVFAAGCGVGLLLFVRLLSWCLHHYRHALLSFLTGVLFGSLAIIWPWKLTAVGSVPTAADSALTQHSVWPWQYAQVADSQLLVAGVCVSFGLVLVLLLERGMKN